MEGQIRVAIIHRNALLRESLSYALSQQQYITMIGKAAKTHDLLDEFETLRPDVVLIHLPDPKHDGMGDIHQLHNVFPKTKILTIGTTTSESGMLACIEAGAAGYCSQESSLEEFLQHIHTAVGGAAIYSPKITGHLFAWLADKARDCNNLWSHELVRLTRREREIILLLAQKYSNKEVAGHLHIAVQTVKNHVHNILRKLQLPNRRELARYASKHGLCGRVS
jgi:DNA-binding NarL/FixJ family response regulator